MNREIKFRGKLKEKGMKPIFFEGSLIHVTSTYKGEEDEQECNVYQIVNEDGVAFFVEEETIRTIYSDYTIKMEKKYMSGDIVRIKNSLIEIEGEVIFDAIDLSFEVYDKENDCKEMLWYTNEKFEVLRKYIR